MDETLSLNETKPTPYVAKISVIMPGQSRPSTYTLGLTAFTRVEALAKAEEEWNKITQQFDIAIDLVKGA
jgi:hypothetical protein